MKNKFSEIKRYKHCNKQIFNGPINKIFCSKTCSYNFRYQKKIPTLISKKCKNCSKIFKWKSSAPSQVFCSVLCLKIWYINNPTLMSYQKLRFEVFKRDNFTCRYCGRNVKEDKIKLNTDHIIPRSMGGKDTYENIVTSCEECNQGKGDIMLNNHLIKKTTQKDNSFKFKGSELKLEAISKEVE